MSVNKATARNMTDKELKAADPCVEVLKEIYRRFVNGDEYETGYQAAIDEKAMEDGGLDEDCDEYTEIFDRGNVLN